MAKKTTKETTVAEVQTIAAKAAEKVAAQVFKQNPDIKEAYVTADGTAFYGRNDAQNHANTLANREVFGFKRNAATAASKPATTSTTTKTDPAAAEASGEADIDELGGNPISDEPANTEE